MRKYLLLVAFIPLVGISQSTQDRKITSYQYRRVPENKINEFIKRETTYWSKVAQKAIDNKTITFWALLEKVGGYDLPNSSNYLFINTYPNIDSAGSVWANAEKVAGVKMEQMETASLSTVTSQFFLHDEAWVQDSKANPGKDYNYVVMIYHNTNYPDSLIEMERKYWGPFIQKAMDDNYTPQTAWGNATLIGPWGGDIKFTTVSYDIYKSLTDALLPNWDPKTVFPNELSKIGAIELSRRDFSIYRIVKVVSAQ